MLRVGLGEHHQLGIGRIAVEFRITGHQVVDLVFGQGQAEITIRGLKRCAAGSEQRDRDNFGRFMRLEERPRVAARFEHRLRHPVEQ